MTMKFVWVNISFENKSSTRKSSCVNTKRHSAAAYQVLHLLSYLAGGEVGTTSLDGGIPHLWGYPIPGQGNPPVWTWLRYCPPPIWTWLGYPPPQVWTGWKHNLPHPSDAGGNKTSVANQVKDTCPFWVGEGINILVCKHHRKCYMLTSPKKKWVKNSALHFTLQISFYLVPVQSQLVSQVTACYLSQNIKPFVFEVNLTFPVTPLWSIHTGKLPML